MTLADNYTPIRYSGNGLTTDFPFTFTVFDEAHLQIFVQNISTNTITLLAPGAYSVSGLPDNGSIHYEPLGFPLAAGFYLFVTRLVPYTQDLEITNQSGFFPETLMKQLDLLEMQIQQLGDASERTWKTEFGVTAGIIPIVPLGHMILGDGAGNFSDGGKVAFSQQDVTAVLAARDETLLLRDEVAIDAAEAVIAAAAADLSATSASASAISADASELAALNAAAAALISETNAAGWAAAPAPGSMYASVAAGLAGTALNGTFWVYTLSNPTLISLWLDDGAAGTLIGDIPTSASIQARIALFEAQSVGVTQQRVGLTTTPVTDASSLNAGDYAIGEMALTGGRFKSFVFWAKINGTVKAIVRRRTGTGNDYTTQSSFDCVVTTAPSLQVFAPNLTMAEGDFCAFYTPAGIIPRPAAAAVFTYFAVNGAATVATFTDASEASDFNLGCYAIIEHDTNLATRMDAVELRAQGTLDKLDAALFSASSAVYSGIVSLPVTTALSAAAGHYHVFGSYQNRHQFVTTIEWWSKVRTTAEIWIVTRSGNDSVRVRLLKRVNCYAEALVSQTLNVRLKPGEDIQVSSVRAGWCSYTAGTVEGYKGFWYGAWTTLSGGIVTDATIDTSNTLQLRITSYLADNATALENGLLFDHFSEPLRLSKQSDPVTGDGVLAAAIIAFELPATSRGLGKTIKWWANGASKTRWWLGTGNAVDGYTMVIDLGTNTYGAGLNTLDISQVIIEPGYVLVGQGNGGGWVKQLSGATNPGLHYLVSAPYLDFFIPFATLTNALAQVSLEYDAITAAASGGVDTHVVDFSTVDWGVAAGQSWEVATYGWAGGDWHSSLETLTGRNIASFSWGGNSVGNLVGLAKANGTLTGVQFSQIAGAHFVIFTEGENDYLTQLNSLTTFTASLAQGVETFGAQYTIIASEGAMIYGAGGEAAIEAVARKYGAIYVSRVQYFNEMCPVTYIGWHQGIWRNLVAGYHPGGRLQSLATGQFWRVLNDLPYAPQYRLMFRKLTSAAAPSITALLWHEDPDNYNLRRKWKPLLHGHRYQTVIGGYDDLQNVPGSPYTEVADERFQLQNGSTVNFGNYLLDVITMDATPRNVSSFTYACPDGGVLIYARDALIVPAAITDPAYGARFLGIGSVTVSGDDLDGLIDGNGKIVLICYKATGMIMGLPVFTFTGKKGKPVLYPPALLKASGASILLDNDFVGLGSWTAVGSVVPDNDATFGLPDGITWFVPIDASNYPYQVMTFPLDTLKSRRALVRCLVQYMPDNRPVPAAATPYSISEDTCNMRQIIVQLIDPNGVPVFGSVASVTTSFPCRPPALLAPVWVQCEISIPSGVPANSLTLAVTTDDIPSDAKMRLFKVYCELME